MSHAPGDWDCIFCRIAAGGETERTKRSAVVVEGTSMTAFVASHWWPANPGHVLIIPNRHIENLYERHREKAPADPLEIDRRAALLRTVL